MKTRLSIRFLVKKSKRLDIPKNNLKKVSKTNNQGEKSSIECLMYLGLVPKDMEPQERIVSKQEIETNFEFPKPRIYECYHCSKFFFHEFLLQKHNVLRHMKSNKRLLSKVWRKKQKLIYRKSKSTRVDQKPQSTKSSSSDLQSRIPVDFPCDNEWLTKEEIEKLFSQS